VAPWTFCDRSLGAPVLCSNARTISLVSPALRTGGGTFITAAAGSLQTEQIQHSSRGGAPKDAGFKTEICANLKKTEMLAAATDAQMPSLEHPRFASFEAFTKAIRNDTAGETLALYLLPGVWHGILSSKQFRAVLSAIKRNKTLKSLGDLSLFFPQVSIKTDFRRFLSCFFPQVSIKTDFRRFAQIDRD
jgi:hypothetical protein